MILKWFGYQFRFPGLISCPELVPNRPGMEFQAYSNFVFLKIRFGMPACARTAGIHLNFYENSFQIIISRYCHLILSLGFDLYGIRKSRQSQISGVIYHILGDKFISLRGGHRSNPDIREIIQISFEYEDFYFETKTLISNHNNLKNSIKDEKLIIFWLAVT